MRRLASTTRAARILGAIALAALLLFLWSRVRHAFFPALTAPDGATLAHAKNVSILRDKWGVPHVFGKTDADAAFGLAYAHAEDDWPTVQGVIAASKGKLGLLVLSKTAVGNDYYVSLARVREEVDLAWDSFGADYREVLQAYAEGLNYYAWNHPEEADARVLPFSGKDIAAGFAHKVPIMLGVPAALKAVMNGEASKVGDRVAAAGDDADARAERFPGSNGHALAAFRSTDGVTRLNVNSHQPWEGPVAWYEAQVVSEQGWNMTGGTFPGAPVILHGHNEHLGWAHTVNAPDLVDVYALTVNPANKNEYRFDGKWLRFEESDAHFEVDVGVATIPISKRVYRSVHGPVIRTDEGAFALRWAGMGRAARAGEQWFRMNKATSLPEFKAAMAIQGIPMFNTVYADRANVYYVYNALVPVRAEGFDYTRVLPGDRRETLWSEYVPFAKLPQVENPPSGFVQNCNTSPFVTTAGEGNPASAEYPANTGIERKNNNRGLRSLALLEGERKLSRDDFLRMKFDRVYAKDSPMMRDVVEPLVATFRPTTEAERQGIELLRAWDGRAESDARGAAIAVLTYRRVDKAIDQPDAAKDVAGAYREAAAFLAQHYGRVDVPLGEVQRLHRGKVDLPLEGGPDVIAAVHASPAGGKLVGRQGDSYVLIVDFAEGGPTSESIHQYGESNRPASPHYADQAPMFVRHALKPTLRTREAIRRNLEREYAPGTEPGAHGGAAR